MPSSKTLAGLAVGTVLAAGVAVGAYMLLAKSSTSKSGKSKKGAKRKGKMGIIERN